MKHVSVGNALTRLAWESASTHTLNGRPAADVLVISVPPQGMCRIINVYYDPEIQKAVFEYDDTPQP